MSRRDHIRGSTGRMAPPMRYRTISAATMQLGSLVFHQGRPYYLRGLDPMSVSDRQAELEDAFTGTRVCVLFDEVEERRRPDRGARLTLEP